MINSFLAVVKRLVFLNFCLTKYLKRMSQNEIDPNKVTKIGKLLIAIISAIIGFFGGQAADSLFNIFNF